MTPRDRIDTLIDDTASRMTSARPSDALRTNVMARITNGHPSRFAWRYVLAGSAAASIALVAFASWPSDLTVPNPTISNPTFVNPAILNSSANPTGVHVPASPLTSVTRTVAAGSGPSVVAVLTDAERDWLSRSVPALEHPEPLMTVRPLSEGAPIKAIDIEPIRVAPLVVLAIGDDNP